jgi:isoamylase
VTAPKTRIVLPDRDGDVWHGFVPGVRAGQAYGFRLSGPFIPAQGLRFNPANYPCAVVGEVQYGPEVLGHAVDDPSAPSNWIPQHVFRIVWC